MFTDVAVKQIAELLKKSQEHHYKGLILDLRNNSGGLLTAAIDIASLFLKKGSLVAITKDNNNKETERYSTKKDPIAHKSLPIFILINNFTASAGEILAGALKIHSDMTNDYLVFLVGTTTFGKGSVQEVIPVSNDCALKITTHLYFLPNDTTIQGIGIDPDFIVERTSPPTEQVQWFTKHFGRENTLENYIKTSPSPAPPALPAPTPLLLRQGFVGHVVPPVPHPLVLSATESGVSKDGDVGSLSKGSNQQKTPNKKEDKKKHNRRYDRAKDMLQKDNQLRDCITLISMLHTAQTYTPDLVKTRSQALSYLKNNFISNDTLDIEEVKL